MNTDKLKKLIAQGEGIDIEFKESKSKLNKNVFETVCAFLNRNGGHIFLGVKDNGTIVGNNEDEIENILKNLLTTVNNPQKLNPPSYLDTNILDIDGKKVISVFVPPSSSVHSLNGRIFDRSGDADINITGRNAQISNLYLRKQSHYSENRIFPYAEPENMRHDLMERVRMLAKNENGGSHPWMAMDDLSMLKSAGLYKKDVATGKEGFTLAGILLFGNDETILSALPHHRTDAILRRDNLDRYDDRDDIRTNLIESYDRLMAFIAKHLKDPFYMEGDRRISIRNKIFREAIANILIHREYSSAYIAKMIIEKEQVVFENANKAFHYGKMTPYNFSPYPKNPTIAKVFREIGWAEELGSGVKNIFKYAKLYGNSDPVIMEEDIFKIIISTTSDRDTEQVTEEKVSDEKFRSIFGVSADYFRTIFGENIFKTIILIADNQAITAKEIAGKLNVSKRTVENYFAKLKEERYIKRVGSDKTGSWKIIKKGSK